jgi:hypothetical protein
MEVKSTKNKALQFTPPKKKSEPERHVTPRERYYNLNLRSSVGECLSWKDDTHEDYESKSVDRARI